MTVTRNKTFKGTYNPLSEDDSEAEDLILDSYKLLDLDSIEDYDERTGKVFLTDEEAGAIQEVHDNFREYLVRAWRI